VDTVIGKETEVKGSISSTGVIRIDGKVEGEIAHKGDVIVGETGRIAANITARNLAVAGSVSGNIDASGKLELLPSARVVGDIKTGSLLISEGALFKGRSEMVTPEERPAKGTAPKG
jgi:cytoskeletal protein CcmA (bactofilin family)